MTTCLKPLRPLLHALGEGRPRRVLETWPMTNRSTAVSPFAIPASKLEADHAGQSGVRVGADVAEASYAIVQYSAFGLSTSGATNAGLRAR